MTYAETVICTFRVRPDSMDSFRHLLDKHWPTLSKLGLVTSTPEQGFLSEQAENDHPTIISIFEWVNGDAAERAHEHPDVAEIWEAMEPLCESRNGRPSMEFPHFRSLQRSQ